MSAFRAVALAALGGVIGSLFRSCNSPLSLAAVFGLPGCGRFEGAVDLVEAGDGGDVPGGFEAVDGFRPHAGASRQLH